MDFCDLHGLTGVRCNPYGYWWSLQIQTYNHSTLYIRTVVSLRWHWICFVNTNVNDLWHKLWFVCLLYMGVLQWSCIPKLCFAMVLTICKVFFFFKIVRIFCHDLTDRSCPRLTHQLHGMYVVWGCTVETVVSMKLLHYTGIYKTVRMINIRQWTLYKKRKKRIHYRLYCTKSRHFTLEFEVHH